MAATFDHAAFQVSMILPEKKFANHSTETHSEHAQNANNMREPQNFSPLFLLRISFDSIIFVLALYYFLATAPR